MSVGEGRCRRVPGDASEDLVGEGNVIGRESSSSRGEAPRVASGVGVFERDDAVARLVDRAAFGGPNDRVEHDVFAAEGLQGIPARVVADARGGAEDGKEDHADKRTRRQTSTLKCGESLRDATESEEAPVVGFGGHQDPVRGHERRVFEEPTGGCGIRGLTAES